MTDLTKVGRMTDVAYTFLKPIVGHVSLDSRIRVQTDPYLFVYEVNQWCDDIIGKGRGCFRGSVLTPVWSFTNEEAMTAFVLKWVE